MKKILFALVLLQSLFVSAQNTQGFSYTSTIRNSNNQIIANQNIKLRFTIRLNSNTGTVVYSETQLPLSDNSGNISVIIGMGTPAIGTFSQINWTLGTHYLGIEFFTGATCQWTTISTGTNGQIVSKCSGLYTLGVCPQAFSALVWSDEFNGSGAISTSNWFPQTLLPDGNNWYNGELQHYTNRQTNIFESNGALNLVAKKETFTDQGRTKQYTSARLNSKFAFKYGRVEVRAKLPSGAGTWPAIWMLGKNIIEPGGYWTAAHGTLSWPACGEIDIMEHWGTNQNYVQSAMHTSSSSGNTVNLGGQTIATASSEFHIYTLVWTAEKMVFSVDNVAHYTYNPSVKNASTWPFDAEQYILLNFAIQSNIISNFTEDAMEVDYVRVYQ
jgi:beta-glucanase (GH16 family)